MARLVVIFIVSMLLSFLGLSWYLWHVNLPLVSPLDVISTFAPNLPFINKPEAQKVVYGFLIIWIDLQSWCNGSFRQWV